MKSEIVNYKFRIKSHDIYNDNEWHEITFSIEEFENGVSKFKNCIFINGGVDTTKNLIYNYLKSINVISLEDEFDGLTSTRMITEYEEIKK